MINISNCSFKLKELRTYFTNFIRSGGGGETFKMCTSYVKFNCVWASIKCGYKYF